MLNTLFIISLIIVPMIFQKPSTMIIAHRGASNDAPENTLAAVNLAWERNSDAVEVDAHLSKDKMVIRESMSSALRSLDASNGMDQYQGERIPFLEEVIATVPEGKVLFIEVKTDTVIIPYLVEVLASSPDKSRLVVISFDFDVCAMMKKEIPAMPVFWLHYTLSGSYKTKWITRAVDAGLDGLNFRHTGISKDYVEAVHRSGMKMFTWTVDDPEDAARLIEFGIDGITSNRPAWLREQLNR